MYLFFLCLSSSTAETRLIWISLLLVWGKEKVAEAIVTDSKVYSPGSKPDDFKPANNDTRGIQSSHQSEM